MDGCHYCGTTERELRPYGPGGSPLCFSCLKDPEHPEREAQAKRAFSVQMDASEVVGGGVSTLGANGPRPATKREQRIAERALRDQPVPGAPEGGE